MGRVGTRRPLSRMSIFAWTRRAARVLVLQSTAAASASRPVLRSDFAIPCGSCRRPLPPVALFFIAPSPCHRPLSSPSSSVSLFSCFFSLSLSFHVSPSPPPTPPSPLSRRPAPFISGRSRLLRRARTTPSHGCGKPVWCGRWRVAGSTRRHGLAGRRCARATADAAARATRGRLVTVPSLLPLALSSFPVRMAYVRVWFCFVCC